MLLLFVQTAAEDDDDADAERSPHRLPPGAAGAQQALESMRMLGTESMLEQVRPLLRKSLPGDMSAALAGGAGVTFGGSF